MPPVRPRVKSDQLGKGSRTNESPGNGSRTNESPGMGSRTNESPGFELMAKFEIVEGGGAGDMYLIGSVDPECTAFVPFVTYAFRSIVSVITI